MLLENRAKMMFFFQLNGAIVNVLLNMLLIPRFGIVGSALATLISYWVGITVLAAILKPLRKGLVMLGKAMISFPTLIRAWR
jgi:Na+-driven multidrug efflux pump